MVNESNCDGKINSVADLISRVKDSGLAEKPLAHVRIWFRGQADAQWKLDPAVYRQQFPATSEEERIGLECQLMQDFTVQSAALLESSKNDAELYFLQQHYRMPTRLLDWTQMPLAALYFAVAEPAYKDTDAALFMIDAFSLAPSQNVEPKTFRGVATSRHPEFRKALKPIMNWSKNPNEFPDFIMPVRPDHFDKRVALQRGCFTFHVPKHKILTKDECNSLKSFFIPQGSKGNLKKELFMLGMDDFAVYGDLVSLSRRLKDAHGIKDD